MEKHTMQLQLDFIKLKNQKEELEQLLSSSSRDTL